MFNDYTQFVLDRAAPQRDCQDIHWNLIHCALGLSTEALEFLIAEREDEKIEELGDLLYYLTLASHTLYHTPRLSPVSEFVDAYAFLETLEAFISAIKKDQIYGNPQHLTGHLDAVWEDFKGMAFLFTRQPTIDNLIQHNMDKLSKRYATTFTPGEAAERKDKQ
jgi:hypothetical protein